MAGVARVEDEGAWAAFEALVHEYLSSLSFSLDFQNVTDELSNLAAEYGPPSGAAFLATEDGAAVGCVAIRQLSVEVAELKRMFVRPAARGRGHGRRLCEVALGEACRLGYSEVRLDTVASMQAAGHLYEAFGFRPIAAYRANPLEDARFYGLYTKDLAPSS